MRATWHQDRFVQLDMTLQHLVKQTSMRVDALAEGVRAAYAEFDNWPLWKRFLLENPRDTRLWTKSRWPVISEFDEAVWRMDNLEQLMARVNSLKGSASSLELSAEEVRFLTKMLTLDPIDV